jgi:hypothetical protein
MKVSKVSILTTLEILFITIEERHKSGFGAGGYEFRPRAQEFANFQTAFAVAVEVKSSVPPC